MPANSKGSFIHLHRACTGNHHASGIAKQNQKQIKLKDQKSVPNGKINSDRRNSNDTVTVSKTRKLSRNSTSSWEYSDSDSLNSSEPGVNSDSHHDRTSRMINKIDRVLDDIDCAKSDTRSSLRLNKSFRSSPGCRFPKNNWEDSLRSGNGYHDDRIKKMEDGWDDSNIIRNPKERKWERITAAAVDDNQRENGHAKVTRRNSLPKKIQGGKILKRTRSSPTRRRPLYDVIEWDEIVEMALARKFGNRSKNGQRGEFLKNLEVLLENKAPLNVQVWILRLLLL